MVEVLLRQNQCLAGGSRALYQLDVSRVDYLNMPISLDICDEKPHRTTPYFEDQVEPEQIRALLGVDGIEHAQADEQFNEFHIEQALIGVEVGSHHAEEAVEEVEVDGVEEGVLNL